MSEKKYLSYIFLKYKLISENGQIVGKIDNNNSEEMFETKANNILEFFQNLSSFDKEWEDCGYGVFLRDVEMLQVKEREMYKEIGLGKIEEKIKKIKEKTKEEAKRYLEKRIKDSEYIGVVYEEKEIIIDKYGKEIDLYDLTNFYDSYPYFTEIEDVPEWIRTEINNDELIKESIKNEQNVYLNAFVKLCTNISNDAIIEMQKNIEKENKIKIFNKDNLAHIMYLVNSLKDLSGPDNKYCEKILVNHNNKFAKYYFSMIKDYLTEIYSADEKLQELMVNTDLISDATRVELVKNNISLIKNLKYNYQKQLDINILKEFINQDINNIKYINITNLQSKDSIYTVEKINEFLCQKRIAKNVNSINKIIKDYNKLVSDYTMNKVILSTPLNSIPDTFKYRPLKEIAFNIMNKYQGTIIEGTNTVYKDSLKRVIESFNKNNINYDVYYIEANGRELINFTNKQTGEEYVKIEVAELSKEVFKKANSNTDKSIKINQEKENPVKTNPPKQEIQNNNTNQKTEPKQQKDTQKKKKKHRLNNINNNEELCSIIDAIDFLEDDLKENKNERKIKEEDEQMIENTVEKLYEDTLENERDIKEKRKKEKIFRIQKSNTWSTEITGVEEHDPDKVNQFLENLFVNNDVNEEILDNKAFVKKIMNLEIQRKPYQTTYVVGEKIDLTGLEVLATFNNGEIKVIQDYTVKKNIVEEGDKCITIYYDDLVADIPIKINNRAATDLIIQKLPKKLKYIEGEVVDLTGLQLKVIYNDGSEEIVNKAKYEMTQNNITLYYDTKSISFNITYIPKKETELFISRQPKKLSFVEGEEIDLEGLQVSLRYNNGETKVINNYDISLKNRTVCITYKNFNINFDIEVQRRSIEKLVVEVKPKKVCYFIGENFNPEGLILTAIYNNGDKEHILDIMETPTIYTDYVTITRQNKSVNIPITILERVPIGLVITSPLIKDAYLKNETIDTDGLQIGLKYNDNTIEKISNFDYSPKSALSVDDTELKIYYNNYTLEIPIKVSTKLFNFKPKKQEKSTLALIDEIDKNITRKNTEKKPKNSKPKKDSRKKASITEIKEEESEENIVVLLEKTNRKIEDMEGGEKEKKNRRKGELDTDDMNSMSLNDIMNNILS